MQSSYVCPHEKMDEKHYTCCKGWLVLVGKCQNQLILGYEAIWSLEVEDLRFETWGFQNILILVFLYVSCPLLFCPYNYFINNLKLSFKSKVMILNLDQILSPLYFNYKDFFSFCEMWAYDVRQHGLMFTFSLLQFDFLKNFHQYGL